MKIFLDTPGIVTPEKRKKHYLEFSLLTDPHACLFEADISQWNSPVLSSA